MKNPLDKDSGKERRGRPARANPSEICGRADHYQGVLTELWDRLWPQLSEAQTDQQVIDAFAEHGGLYAREFVPLLSNLIRRVLQEPRFPKREEAQIKFLADSIAGLNNVTPRRSRDICEKERIKERRAHHILRYEYYVECSCGYIGQSRNHACEKCGAKIDFETSYPPNSAPE